jgi:hypothetical protein
MTEASQVRSAINTLSVYGVVIPISDRVGSGVPDHHYVLRRVAGWLEAKVIPPSGGCPAHFTREQLMWGEDYVAAGGLWHLLGLVERKPPLWRLYDTIGARAWFEGATNDLWLLNLSGPFPTRQVLDCIAPLPKAR